MKQIIFNGVVGVDVTADSLRKSFLDAGSEEIDLHVASPGGFVFDGLEIFNLIRDHNENKAKVNISLKGLAASMASYIALSVPVEQIKAEDNAILMIHNVWSLAVGDHRDLMKEAKEMVEESDIKYDEVARKLAMVIFSEFKRIQIHPKLADRWSLFRGNCSTKKVWTGFEVKPFIQDI
jgi:ATP-dependent protease ClpP protease subunit